MSEILSIKPLGEILCLADLISAAQIELALQEQTQNNNMRIGEILASRGWLKQETADFFAERWTTLLNQKSKQPLGVYLQQAGLLDEHQVKIILSEQKQMGLRFGECAVYRGWLKPTTINFFLEHIAPEQNLSQQRLQQEELSVRNDSTRAEIPNLGSVVQKSNSPIVYQTDIEQKSAHLKLFSRSTIKLFKLDEKASRPDILLEKILSWTGGQPFLTQKVCQLLANSETFISVGDEAFKVQQLIQTRLIERWEIQIASEHFKAIRYALLGSHNYDPFLLLQLYQQILQQQEISYDSSAVAELLHLGLILQEENKLIISNRIYRSVFNLNWVNEELIRLDVNRNRIQLFKLDEKSRRPYVLLEEVFSWTNGQPFLTQKLCQLLASSQGTIPIGDEAVKVEQLVQTRLIDHWENRVLSEHLEAIRNDLLGNQRCNSLLMLRLYKQILQNEEILVDGSPPQVELLNLGLVVQQENTLIVSNRIYQSVFNLNWVKQELEKRTPVPSQATTTITYQNPPPPTITSFKAKKTISKAKKSISKSIPIFLGIIGLFVVGLGIVRSSLVKPREVEILFQKGNELFSQGEYIKAIAKYNEILKIDKNYYQAWTNQGYALAGLQQYDKMLESCSAATHIDSKAVYGWNCQGEALYNLKRYDEAIAAFDQAIAINSKEPISWINKTESLLALNQVDKALATINEAIDLLEQNTEVSKKETIARDLSVAYSHKGKALSRKPQYQEALEAYDKALTYDPNYFAAQRGRGIALQGLKQYDEAIAQFEGMLKEKLVDAQRAETWYYKGATLCKASRVQEAIVAFDEALKAKPDYQAVEQAKRNCRSY